MWGKWLVGLMLVGVTALVGGCERSDQDDVRGVGGAPGTVRGVDEGSPEQQAIPEDDGVAPGEMIKDGGRMVRPGEE